MDPLSILSISCAVMQITSFSHELFSVAKRISKEGLPDASLAGKVAHLADISVYLQNHLATKQNTKSLSKIQQSIQDTAQKCLTISREITEEFNKIEWKRGPESPTTMKRKPIFQGLMWSRRRSKIKTLEKEMDEVEKLMRDSILEDIWLSQEAIQIQQSDSFERLDEKLQNFIQKFTRGQQKLESVIVNQGADIKKEIAAENIKTRDHFSTQLRDQDLKSLSKEEYDKFLGSLQYDTMNARKSAIVRSHEHTFDWIFDDTTDVPWHNLSKWMGSDERIYWISGKPGSGKSTLMKFLVDDTRTKDRLKEWAPDVEILSFFLWSVITGNIMQRSIHGILCALLHQLLSSEIGHKLTDNLFITEPDTNHSFCIFLDGLDEIDRDEGCFSMVQLVEILRTKTNTKLCISSRPELAFQDAFRGYPMLKLQDLTKKDIILYVQGFLMINFKDLGIDQDDDGIDPRQKVIDAVVERADGVFLWVHLVLKSLVRGASNRDTYATLAKRISQRPKRLEGLYEEAWNRHG
ncbi:hypothetical protein F5884DRAFT_739958 [Xylogone sp. PMI_703]|nr:hypothetical protein F5884DRAFT_739958 [Xylogone sp. PMI_703]